MKQTFTKGLYILLLTITCLLAGFSGMAQLITTTLETGKSYAGLATDNAGNLFFTRMNPTGTAYELVRYDNGNPANSHVILSNLKYGGLEYPWSVAVNSTGNVYVMNPDQAFGYQIIRLIPTGATTYSSSPILSGNFYSAITFDNADNLYTLEYNGANNNYEVVKRTAGAGETAASGTVLYSGLPYPTGAATLPYGIAIDNLQNIYILDFHENSNGRLLKLTAPSYTLSVIGTGKTYTAVEVDASNNVYTTEATSSSTAQIVKYTAPVLAGASGSPVYTGLSVGGNLYPWGMSVSSGGDLFYVADPAAAGLGRLLKLAPPNINITSVTLAGTSPTNAATVSFTVKFNGTASTVPASAFTLVPTGVSSASIASVTGSGDTYTVTVNTGTGDGTIGLNVNGTGIVPTVTNAPFTGPVYTIDKTAPTGGAVSINTGANYATNANVTLTITSPTDANGPVQMSVDRGDGVFAAYETITATKAVTLLPVGDGTKTVQIRFKDAAGNIATVTDNIILDATAPTFQFTAPLPNSISSSSTATFTFVANEPGCTFQLSIDAGPPNTYTSPHTFTGLAEGPHTISGRAIDPAGNIGNLGTAFNWIIDTHPPTLTSVTPPADGYYRAGMQLNFVVNYDENVVVTGTPSLTLNVGGVTRNAIYVSGSGTPNLTFRYTVVAGDDDQDGIGITPQIQLNGATLKDAGSFDAPTNFTAPGLANVRVKTDKPTVAITMAEPSPINHAFTVTFTFSDPIAGFDNSDLTISALSMTPVTSVDGGKTWTATVTPSVPGPGTIMLPADKAFDIAGNGNQTGTLNFVFDNTAPGVSLLQITSRYYRAGDVINVAVGYSEPVLVTGSPYINIVIGSTTRQATLVSGSGTNTLNFSYMVQAGEVDDDGVAILPITLNGGTIQDAAGNNAALGFAITFPGALVDAVPPTISPVFPPADGYYKEGDVMVFTIRTSENVTRTGAPTLDFTLGSTVRQATYVSGSGTNLINFSYTVVAGDNDDDGIVINPTLSLNGGTLRDAAGNDAVLTMGGIPSTANVKVNTVHPTVTITGVPPIANGPFTITITFSEFIPGNLSLAGMNAVNANLSNLNTADHIIWTALITPPANTESSASIQVLNNAVTNIAGNGNQASNLFTFNIDTKPPVISAITPPGDGYYKAGDVLTYTIAYDQAVTITGTPTLPVIIGGTTHDVPLTSSTATDLTFSYTVVTGEQDLDGVSLGTAINLNGGSIKDAGANDAPLTVTSNTPGVLVDAIIPTITSVDVPANGYYKAGQVLSFIVHTSENINITGTPFINVNIGGVNLPAAFAGGSGSSTLIFSYTVVSGDNDMDGIEPAANLNLNGGTAADAAGNNVLLPLNSIPSTNGVFVNTVTPGVSLSTTAPGLLNAPFTITATFTEMVTGFTASDVTVNNGTAGTPQSTDGGVTYTILITPAADGPVDIDILADVAFNIGNNGNSRSSNQLHSFYDHTRPAAISVTAPAGVYKAGDVLTFTVNFNEIENVDYTGGTPYLDVNIGGVSRQATVTGDGLAALEFSYTIQPGDLDLDGPAIGANIIMNGGRIHDAAGNDVLPAVTGSFPTVIIDAVAPTITSVDVPINGYYKEGDILDFRVHTSEDVIVTGTPVMDINIGGVTRQAVYNGPTGATTNRMTFSYTVVSGDNDMDGIMPAANLNLNGSTIVDAAGNNLLLPLNGTASTASVFVNTVIPSVSISSTAPARVNAPFTVTVAFSEPVTIFTETDMSVTNGTAAAPQVVDSKTYTVVITPTADGTVSVFVRANSVVNIGGNPNTASNTLDRVYDHTPPAITAVDLPATATYKAGDVLNFTVHYDEPIFVNTAGGSPFLNIVMTSGTKTATYAGGNGTNELSFSYTVQNGDLDADGIAVAPNLQLGGGTIRDEAGNNASVTLSNISTNVVMIDAVAPTITSVDVPTNGYYREGMVLTFVAHASEIVDVTGSPVIDVNIGGVTRQAEYTSGTGTNVLRFAYTVVSGDNDMDGIVPATDLNLNGGTVADVTGNDLLLPLNGTPSTSGVFVNTVIPSVVLSTTAPLLVNAPFTVTATFSEEVSNFTDLDFFTTNASVGTVNTTDHITYTVVITPTTDGPVSVVIPASAAINIGGNPNTASNRLDLTYDGTAPAITSVDLPATGTYKVGDVLNFTVHYNENVTVNTTGGIPFINVAMTSATKPAAYTSGDGTQALTFTYTVQNGDLDADGISLAGNLQLNGATIRDAATNDAGVALTGISANVVKVDAVAPTITSVDVPAAGYYKNGNVLNFTVHFSENVTVTGTPALDILIGGTTKQALAPTVSGNSLNFSYTVQPGDQDLDGIELAANLNLNGATLKDAIGNDLDLTLHGAGNTNNVYVYSVVPAVTFSGIQVNAPFTLSVIFSEAVTGFDISDIVVTNATLSSFNTTDNITYTVLLTPAAQGGVTIKVPANAAVNIAGTGNAASAVVSYYYDGTPPAITSVDVPANGYYKAGDVLTFTVHFAENVNVANTANGPLLPVIIGSNTVNAKYIGGGGANGDLVFTYTVVDGDMDLDGIALGTALSLGGSIIRDPSGNNAVLTINNPANSSLVRVNTAHPSISITSGAAARVKAAFTATITFSEAVTGFAIGDIVVNNGTLSNLQTTDNITYTVTITPGTDGPVTINVPAAVAVNNAGNDNTASNGLSRTVDKTVPVIASTTFNVNNNAAVGTLVGQLTATDASGVIQDWTITADGSGGAFAIDANGNITVKDAALLDARASTTVPLSIMVSDGLNNSAPTAIAINVILAFVNKTPTLDAINNVSICTSTDVHTIQLTGASAVEAGQTYTITATANQPYFDDLSVSAAGVLSYKLKSTVTSGTATISVTIKDDGGTANGAVDQLIRTFTITVNDLPAITISSDKGTTVSKGEVIHLTATGGSTYAWTNVDGIISGQQTAVLEVKTINNTTYEVTATSAAGCSSTASISIATVEDFKVDATNILTPNGDGKNDKWVIRNLDAYPNNVVQVFDRAGRLILERRNYANDWDGTVNGKPLAEGTYYYILRINDGAKTAKGYITIIRDDQ